MRRATTLIWLVLLPACAPMQGQLANLRAKNPTADTFPQALASEYLAYSQSLAEEGHPIRANYFAGKGLTALDKGDVALEEKPALADSRSALLEVLTPDVKEVAPAKAARAQLLFDCWADKETVCKESFAEALDDLQSIADALVHEGDNSFEIRFAPKSAVLSKENMAIIGMVAKRVANLGEYQVELSPVEKLAVKRSLAVQKALIAQGVDAGRIRTGKKSAGKAVVLSIDKDEANPDTIIISIKTYGQPAEKTSP